MIILINFVLFIKVVLRVCVCVCVCVCANAETGGQEGKTLLTFCIEIRITIVNRPLLERRLNWIPDPAPTPPRNHNKENHPPAAEQRKLPRKMSPRRKRREHHQQPGASGSATGNSQPPISQRSTPVKHPKLPQLPQPHQPPRPAANENSSRAHLPGQPDVGRLYKQAHPTLNKDTSTRSRQDNFSGSNLSFNCSQRSHRDYFSG